MHPVFIFIFVLAVLCAAVSGASTPDQSDYVARRLDGSGTPLAFEQGQMDGGDGGGDPSPLPPAPILEREYVWGPGDTGIDELLVQYDAGRNPWWVVQDGGGDVVALCDLGGSGSDARVVAQWTYDAYGAALSADHLHAHPYIHCGHKALFADRLDVGVATAYGQPLPRIVPFARVLCHVRNRVYQPELGRWNQADPNATALVLLESSSYHGMGMAAVVAAFDVETRYGDGMNLYEYLGSNPWNRRDPMGLSWDPFEMVDDYLATTAGERAAFLGQLGQDAKALAIVTATIASYLPFPAVNVAGEIALVAMGQQTTAQTAIGLSIGLFPGGKLGHLFARTRLGGMLTSFASRIGQNVITVTGAYIQKGISGILSRTGKLSSFIAAKYFGKKIGRDIIDEIFAGGAERILRGKSPLDLPELEIAARRRNWNIDTLSKGQDVGSGWKIVNPNGDEAIYWKPNTSGRHVEGPYWRVSSGKTGRLPPIPARFGL